MVGPKADLPFFCYVSLTARVSNDKMGLSDLDRHWALWYYALTCLWAILCYVSLILNDLVFGGIFLGATVAFGAFGSYVNNNKP